MNLQSCPICGSSNYETISEFPHVPVLCNALFSTMEDAKAANTGDIELVICMKCAMIWNRAFDEKLMAYASGYENALHHSVSFQRFAKQLVGDLMGRHDLIGEAVFEVGCGDGYLLREFVNQGVANAVGFDPSMDGRSSPFADGYGVEILPENFDPSRTPHDCKLALCRHVLEHISQPAPFLKDLLSHLPRKETPLYFEVPNSTWLLSKPSPWDVIYEHVSYWTEPSLAKLFAEAGRSNVVVSTAYDDQFLQIETASKGTVRTNRVSVEDILDIGNTFSQSTAATINRWDGILSQGYENVVVWGAGSKGITFANMATFLGYNITALIDQNPLKHGLHIPVAATPVLPPESLGKIKPDLVVISNGLYEAEITQSIKSMGQSSSIKTL